MLLIVNVSALFHRLGSRNKSDGLHLADKVERETQMSLCVIIKNKSQVCVNVHHSIYSIALFL